MTTTEPKPKSKPKPRTQETRTTAGSLEQAQTIQRTICKPAPRMVSLPGMLGDRLKDHATFIGVQPHSIVRALIKHYLDNPHAFERTWDESDNLCIVTHPTLPFPQTASANANSQ